MYSLLVLSYAGCYIDGQCMNQLMYAYCLLGPTAIAMQQLLDICNDYFIASYITFNPLMMSAGGSRTIRRIGSAIWFSCLSGLAEPVYDANYFGFTFCVNKKHDCDILKQVFTLHAKSNKIIRTFSHCTIDETIVNEELLHLFLLWIHAVRL